MVSHWNPMVSQWSSSCLIMNVQLATATHLLESVTESDITALKVSQLIVILTHYWLSDLSRAAGLAKWVTWLIMLTHRSLKHLSQASGLVKWVTQLVLWLSHESGWTHWTSQVWVMITLISGEVSQDDYVMSSSDSLPKINESEIRTRRVSHHDSCDYRAWLINLSQIFWLSYASHPDSCYSDSVSIGPEYNVT